MNQNSTDCIECIKRNLSRLNGVDITKSYEKKRKFSQKDVDPNAQAQKLNINQIIERINYYEDLVKKECSPKNAQLLIAHYNKAIEYYATFNDDQHLEWLMKLQNIFKDENIQKAMSV